MPDSDKHLVTISVDGDVQTHCGGGVSDFATICGLDGADDGAGQETVSTPKGQKVTCETCKIIWEIAKQYRKSDFAN